MRISAVIPTTGRESLAAAVASAAGQSHQPLEILVVYDGAEPPELPDGVADNPLVTVLQTGARQGGAAARNLGVEQASGELIALLDDDDLWAPDKLAIQVARYVAASRDTERPVIVACGQAETTPDGIVRAVTPRHAIAAEASIAEYLFAKREIRPGEAAISSSMVLTSRDLLRRVRFDESLARHQDWDWLLRAESEAGAVVLICPETLVTYTRQPPGRSVSAGGTWQSSLAWAESDRYDFTPRQRGNILLTVTAPIAARNRDWPAVIRIARISVRYRPAPAAWPFVVVDTALAAWRGRGGRSRS